MKVGKDTKQPYEVLDYDVDYGDWLPSGDTLDAAQVEVRLLSGPQSPALTVDSVQTTRAIAKVWLSGGAHGSRWRVQVRATTVGARVKEAEFDIAVKEI